MRGFDCIWGSLGTIGSLQGVWGSSGSNAHRFVPVVSVLALAAAVVLTYGGVAQVYADDRSVYEAVRRTELAGDFDAAIAGKDEIEAAIRASRDALENPATIPYRGEVLTNLAELLLIQSHDPATLDEAMQLVIDAITWSQETSATTADSSLTTPAALVPAFAGPSFVANAQTTTWYVPMMAYRAHLLCGYLYSQMGNVTAADAAFAEAQKINNMHGGSHGSSDLWRLREDAKDGAFFISRDVWDKLSPQHVPRLRLGFFHYMSGNIVRTKPLFAMVDSAAKENPGDALDWSAAYLGMGICLYHEDDVDGAIKWLKQFNLLFRQGELAPLGRFIFANLQAGRTGQYDEAVRTYGDIAREYPASPIASRALLALSACAINQGDHATVQDGRDRLTQQYPDSPYVAVANILVDLAYGRSSTNSASTDRQGPRRAMADDQQSIVLQRVVINPLTLPSLTLPQQNAAIIVYELVGDLPTPILGITAWRCRFNECEPQVAPTAKDQMTVYRLSALATGTN